ncbi:hypothetical protein CFP56_009859 [Quercus suber]|uniref:Uncharacterized protein n=1 Tax=Quercus suber TaxID=58331 RepID=A0AAW0L338_QUESU
MAGALVGGAFLSAFLQVAFDRVASREIYVYLNPTGGTCSIIQNNLYSATQEETLRLFSYMRMTSSIHT